MVALPHSPRRRQTLSPAQLRKGIRDAEQRLGLNLWTSGGLETPTKPVQALGTVRDVVPLAASHVTLEYTGLLSVSLLTALAQSSELVRRQGWGLYAASAPSAGTGERVWVTASSHGGFYVCSSMDDGHATPTTDVEYVEEFSRARISALALGADPDQDVWRFFNPDTGE